jgi:hypothetical protein
MNTENLKEPSKATTYTVEDRDDTEMEANSRQAWQPDLPVLEVHT